MSQSIFGNPDVIVVGAGNAAACAALAARESGGHVIMLEAAPLDECGGNSRYTAGAMRRIHCGGTCAISVINPRASAKRANCASHSARFSLEAL